MCMCVMRLGVGDDGSSNEEKKRRTLNSVDDEQNLLDAVVEYGVRKNEEKEFVC
jgi:hypothetical protein